MSNTLFTLLPNFYYIYIKLCNIYLVLLSEAVDFSQFP